MRNVIKNLAYNKEVDYARRKISLKNFQNKYFQRIFLYSYLSYICKCVYFNIVTLQYKIISILSIATLDQMPLESQRNFIFLDVYISCICKICIYIYISIFQYFPFSVQYDQHIRSSIFAEDQMPLESWWVYKIVCINNQHDSYLLHIYV